MWLGRYKRNVIARSAFATTLAPYATSAVSNPHVIRRLLWLGFVVPSSLTNKLFADRLKAWVLEAGNPLKNFTFFRNFFIRRVYSTHAINYSTV